MTAPVLTSISGGLIVSSQVMDPRSPLDSPEMLGALAQAAVIGGAVGVRVAGPEVVATVRALLPTVPIIGITKVHRPGSDTYITATAAEARSLVDAGADIVAAQATEATRPAETFAEVADAVHRSGRLMMADIATAAEAERAVADGADMVATTMVGHTPQTRDAQRPPIPLVRALSSRLTVPVIAEGGLWTREDVAAVFDAGAFAVVVGSALTAPDLIAARFTAVTPAGGPPAR